MQDIHTLGGGAGAAGAVTAAGGRIFGDRSLRPHHHHQALKCPRCESLNTKFCYYNNYNLSQPRHFCKNCRRYWTKGGVLRNVPVGGGCRKSKRSSKPKLSSTSASAAAAAAAGTSTAPVAPADMSNSCSSGESTSNTTSTTNTSTATTNNNNTSTTTTPLSTPITADVGTNSNSVSDVKSSIPTLMMNESQSQTLSASTPSNCSLRATAAGILRFPSEPSAFSTLPSGLNINFEPLIDHNPFAEIGNLMTAASGGHHDHRNDSKGNDQHRNINGSNMFGFEGCDVMTTPFKNIGGCGNGDYNQFVPSIEITAPSEWQLDKMGADGGIEDVKGQDLACSTGGLFDHHRFQFDLFQNRGSIGNSSSCGTLAGLDWQSSIQCNGGSGGCGGSGGGPSQHQQHLHQGWFDLPSGVDQANYWSQTTQWPDNDHHLFLPP